MIALAPGDGPARVGVLDRNRAVLTRAARAVRAACGLAPVAVDSDPAGLRSALAPDARLLICDEADVDLAREWATTRFPQLQIVAWSHGPMEGLIAAAGGDARLRSLIGWPAFESMPRPWELALAVRRVMAPTPASLPLGELFVGAPVACKLRPRTSVERDVVTERATELAMRVGASERTVARIAGVCHELVMNAMYDAPVDHYGQPRYAFDRRAALALDDHEVPTVRFATDGSRFALQVTDPFGLLTRAHVLEGIARGQAAARAADAAQVIDDRHGGAGLGMWRSFAAATLMFVDVVLGHSTTVTCVFDLDVSPREARTLPPSLHL